MTERRQKALLELDDPAHSAGSTADMRARMPTLTDDVALEHARLQSLPSNAPPAARITAIPASLPGPRDSLPEVDVGESDVEALGADEQVAILRARLAPLSRVPLLAHALTHVATEADPKTAYVAGFIDGVLPLETIIDVTGLPELDTLRVLDRLATLAILHFRVLPS